MTSVRKTKTIFSVQVRELVAFAWRRGDLAGERDFVGRDRALAGTRGHQRIQRSRPEGYQKEVKVSHDLETDEFILRIQGRIDGLLATPADVLLEEIKTVQSGWDGEPDPLHWAQARIYGFIYAQNNGVEHLTIQLSYLDLDSGRLSESQQRFSFADLNSFFLETTAIYLEWVRERYQWGLKRNESIAILDFPFAKYRAGQRELAVAAYRTLARGGRLFLEAPTGIGKTISVLFPAVKALGEGRLERIFYLTARTVGRAVAEKALADLRAAGLHLQAVTLTARDKLCLQDNQPCDRRDCPLAKGYYDRYKPAMHEALELEEITRPVLEAVSAKHQVCPFELSLDLSSWVDAVICDYNYVFDPRVYLRRHFGEQPGDYAFLIDEAHNLVDRARDMFSSELNTADIQDVRKEIKETLPGCARSLSRLISAIRKLSGGTGSSSEPSEPSNPRTELNLFQPNVAPRQAAALASVSRFELNEPRTSRELPAELMPLVEEALTKAETWLAGNQPAEFRESLLQLFFHMLSFQRTAELYDERFVTILEPGPVSRVRLFCLDPSFLLQQALARGRAAIFFSATLTPIDYYRTLLGGRPEDPILQLPSPFPPENLGVLVHDRVRTDFKSREGTLASVVEAAAAFVRGRPGNYLVYLPSYQYLTAVRDQFQTVCPEIPILAQRPAMNDSEREDFLGKFSVDHTETLVGFAVLGGIFGEGIDLVGERLIGAVIVGVGLPQLCVERNLIRDYFDAVNGAGFEYAYVFPGMNRVLQAIGRVIRSENDRGAVLLIDARFAEARYRRLFPPWWRPVPTRSAEAIGAAAGQFWPWLP